MVACSGRHAFRTVTEIGKPLVTRLSEPSPSASKMPRLSGGLVANAEILLIHRDRVMPASEEARPAGRPDRRFSTLPRHSPRAQTAWHLPTSHHSGPARRHPHHPDVGSDRRSCPLFRPSVGHSDQLSRAYRAGHLRADPKSQVVWREAALRQNRRGPSQLCQHLPAGYRHFFPARM